MNLKEGILNGWTMLCLENTGYEMKISVQGLFLQVIVRGAQKHPKQDRLLSLLLVIYHN